jgi:hypothetical protein
MPPNCQLHTGRNTQPFDSAYVGAAFSYVITRVRQWFIKQTFYIVPTYICYRIINFEYLHKVTILLYESPKKFPDKYLVRSQSE